MTLTYQISFGYSSFLDLLPEVIGGLLETCSAISATLLVRTMQIRYVSRPLRLSHGPSGLEVGDHSISAGSRNVNGRIKIGYL